jgi:hypothetical protein
VQTSERLDEAEAGREEFSNRCEELLHDAESLKQVLSQAIILV